MDTAVDVGKDEVESFLHVDDAVRKNESLPLISPSPVFLPTPFFCR